jgi:hypothetical protein
MRRFLLATIALAVTCSAASAQDKRAAREACLGDYKQFCQGVQPGQGRIIQCLQGHLEQLQPACRSVVESRIAARK